VTVELTRSRRKVVRGVHDVVELSDGTLEFSRNAKVERWMNHSFYVARGETIEAVPLDFRVNKIVERLKTKASYAVARWLDGEEPGEEARLNFVAYCVNVFASVVNYQGLFRTDSGSIGLRNLTGWSVGSGEKAQRWAEMAAIAPEIVANPEVPVSYLDRDLKLAYAKIVLALNEWMNEKLSAHGHLPAPPPVPTIESVAEALTQVAATAPAAAPAPRYVVAA